MIINYNYATNQEQKWYSEQEYNKLKKELKMQKTIKLIKSILVFILTFGIFSILWVSLLGSYLTLIKINEKLDKLIELNQPEAIQIIVPDKPLLEDR